MIHCESARRIAGFNLFQQRLRILNCAVDFATTGKAAMRSLTSWDKVYP